MISRSLGLRGLLLWVLMLSGLMMVGSYCVIPHASPRALSPSVPYANAVVQTRVDHIFPEQIGALNRLLIGSVAELAHDNYRNLMLEESRTPMPPTSMGPSWQSQRDEQPPI
jgi:hypothetical protein